MTNYITETILKGFIPELTKHLWNGESDFSKQGTRAEEIVISDLIDKGYKISELQSKLLLSSDGTEDLYNRLRYVLTVTAITTPVTVTLQGSFDDTTYNTITTITPTTTGTTTAVFPQAYTYYKVVKTGTVTYTMHLVETAYDNLFAYKWLELILMDSFREEGDRYYTLAKHYQELYNKKISTMLITTDSDGDGEPEESTFSNQIKFGR